MTAEVVLFVVLAAIAIGAGIGMVAMRNIVHGALMLVINLLALAGLYLVLQSTFLSVVQVIVYAGAIMVLFLFVIMLLGIDRDDLLVEVGPVSRGVAVLAGVGVVAMLGWAMIGPYTTDASICDPDAAVVRTADTQSCVGMDGLLANAEQGSVEIVANDLFTRWTFPFEAAALLLIVATIGAMLLGRRKWTDPDADPAWEPSMRLPDDDHDVPEAPEAPEAPDASAGGGDNLAGDDELVDDDASDAADTDDAIAADDTGPVDDGDVVTVGSDAGDASAATTDGDPAHGKGA